MKNLGCTAACLLSLIACPAIGQTVGYSIVDLGTLGGTISFGYSINASGQATGQAHLTDNKGPHAFFYDGTMHDVGTLAQGSSSALGINSNGLIAGFSFVSTGVIHAFVYDGSLHDIGTLAGTISESWSINDSGLVVGNTSYLAGNSNTHAFIYDGVMHDLGTLGGSQSGATGINASGQITGFANTVANVSRAFFYDGTMHDIGALIDGGTSSGRAISDNGLIVGKSTYSTQTANQHAFLYDGSMHDLGTIGSYDQYSAFGVDNSGQVVGRIDDANRAFLYTKEGGMVDLNSLIDPQSGWLLQGGGDINEAGQIVGWGRHNNLSHAYILTPNLPGDMNHDGRLTTSDLPAMLAALADIPSYEQSKGINDIQMVTIGDVNLDGRMDNGDIQALLNVLIHGPVGAAFPVPEPGTFAIAAIGLVVLAAGRRVG